MARKQRDGLVRAAFHQETLEIVIPLRKRFIVPGPWPRGEQPCVGCSWTLCAPQTREICHHHLTEIAVRFPVDCKIYLIITIRL